MKKSILISGLLLCIALSGCIVVPAGRPVAYYPAYPAPAYHAYYYR